VIKVNGYASQVPLNSDFPVATAADPTVQPIFHLVSLAQRTAKIGIVGGSYSTGSPTLTITVGKPVTLMNRADGTRYTIELMPQGTTVPTTTDGTATQPAPTTPTSTSATTTTSTGTTTTGTTTSSH
jgi:hypothetical protein